MPEKEEKKEPESKLKPLRDTNKEDVITNAIDFWKKIYEYQEVQIRFIKKNGEERVIKCTLQEGKFPLYEKKTDREKTPNKDILSVWDLEKEEWRSFKLDSIKNVEFGIV